MATRSGAAPSIRAPTVAPGSGKTEARGARPVRTALTPARAPPRSRRTGRVAQRESIRFTREGSQVQSLSRPPSGPLTRFRELPTARPIARLAQDRRNLRRQICGLAGPPADGAEASLLSEFARVRSRASGAGGPRSCRGVRLGGRRADPASGSLVACGPRPRSGDGFLDRSDGRSRGYGCRSRRATGRAPGAHASRDRRRADPAAGPSCRDGAARRDDHAGREPDRAASRSRSSAAG